MKIQTLYKRLSMPLLLTVISATGIGVSTPARSASLINSQNTAIDANPEATLIARTCRRGEPPHLCTAPPPARVPIPEKPETDKPEINKPEIEQPNVDKPKIEQPNVDKPKIEQPNVDKPEIDKPTIEKPNIENRTRYQRQRLQQSPTVDPSPNN